MGNNYEEEKKEGDSRDMIAIEHVINDTSDNYACEDLNTIVKAVPNGKLNICVKLGSIGKSTNMWERDNSKVLGTEVTESVRTNKLL